MTTLTVLLLIGATARATLLVTTDAIFEPARSYVESRVGDRVAYLIRCDWCMSVWVGAAMFSFGWYAPGTTVLLATGALTASLFTGWLSTVDKVLASKLYSNLEDDQKGGV